MTSHLMAGASALALSFAVLSAAGSALADTPTADGATSNDVVVTSHGRPPNLTTVPAVVEGATAQQIQTSINALTAAETLKYLPSIEVRERSIGDRNGIISTRTTGTISSAESLVYDNELLLSNLLGNSYSYPPRWGLVSPSEIERVDVIYGPFSALYPGNSMGGVITLTTHMPDKAELHLATNVALEDFKLYGTSEHNLSNDTSVSAGDRFGAFSIWAGYDRLDAQGHPLSFSTANLSTKAAAGSAAPVTGAFQDLDQNGNPRLVFGGYSIDHTVQNEGKIKLGYDVAPHIKLVYTLGIWSDRSDVSAQTFLTNTANGQPFYNGAVNIGGKAYTVSGVNPSVAAELHVLNAISASSDTKGVFDWQVSASDYSFLNEKSRSASNFGQTLLGTDQIQNGTGWWTGDLRGIWRPAADLPGNHEVSFGYHIDTYTLRQSTYTVAAWETAPDGALSSASTGKTQTQALYIQDVWRIAPPWTLTLGGREEFWNASNGSNTNASTTPALATYPSQSRSDFSPKAALSWDVSPELTTRFSYGRAVRYPTVTELYQQVTSGSTLVHNNPNLKPEDVSSYDWTTQYTLNGDSLRVSLFEEDRGQALFSQTDTTVSPNLTQIENITAVRIRGAETALDAANVLIKGIDLSGSVTYADSGILSDTQAPTAVGRQFPRIPRWRARLVATYRQDDRLSYSLGYRFASGAFSTLLNTDVNHGVYGGISAYGVLDAKVNYKISHQITASVGVDNLTNDHYFVSPHPYPQTTGFVGLKYDY
jgi:iron complex outermembrane receptor protein